MKTNFYIIVLVGTCMVAVVGMSMALHFLVPLGTSWNSSEVIGFYESTNKFTVDRLGRQPIVERAYPDEKGCFYFPIEYEDVPIGKRPDSHLEFNDASIGEFVVHLTINPMNGLDTELLYVTHAEGGKKPKVKRTVFSYIFRRGLSLRNVQRIADLWRLMVRYEYFACKWIPLICPADTTSNDRTIDEQHGRQ